MTCKTLAQDIDQSIAATSNTASDSFVFTRNATAYKIPFSSMSSSLGVTGTISTVGSPTSVAILNKPSAGYNYIRNIAPSQGITATLDAYGSIAIKSNFANAGGTAQAIKDVTAAQIGVRGITAGDGITVLQRTNDILISTTTATVSSKTVIVNSIDDFPTALAGVITLDNETDYFIATDISTSNRFVVGNKTTLRGPSSQIVMLTYTGSDTMLTGANPSMRIDRITLNCPSAKCFDMSSTGLGIFQIIESNILSCDTVGDIGSMFLVRFKGFACQSVTTRGINFTGSIDLFIADTVITFIDAGSVYDFGTALFNSINITNNYVKSTGATTFITGAANSANINTGGFATVSNTRIAASVTSLSGVSEDDSRWNFLANDAIPDTRPDALLSFSTPTTTVIATVDTPTLVAGTWAVERNSQMTATAAGRVTYNGERDAVLPITVTIGMEPVSGSNKSLAVYVFKNGVEGSASEVNTVASAGSPKNLVVAWQDSWSNGDYYEVYIENHTDAIDIQVNNAIIRVN